MRYLAVAVMVGLLVGLVPLGASADVIVLDFGPTGSAGFSGTFDGSTGFIHASQTNGNMGNVTFDLGGSRFLNFVNVGAYSLGADVPAELSALTNDFFFSAGAYGADNPVSFTLSGVLPTDYVTFEFLGSLQTGANATFGSSVTTTVPTAASSFTQVGDANLTGSSSYNGTFTGILGGEGDISGARITINAAIPEPTVAASMLIGLGLCGSLLRRRFKS